TEVERYFRSFLDGHRVNMIVFCDASPQHVKITPHPCEQPQHLLLERMTGMNGEGQCRAADDVALVRPRAGPLQLAGDRGRHGPKMIEHGCFPALLRTYRDGELPTDEALAPIVRLQENPPVGNERIDR